MKFRFRLAESAEMSNEYDSEGNQLTKEQSEFFKNSKVRDKQGRLLVCYHGTKRYGFQEFNTIDPPKHHDLPMQLDFGSHFTDSKKFAKTYGKYYAVYLNITNPIFVEDPYDNTITKDNITIEGYDGVFYNPRCVIHQSCEDESIYNYIKNHKDEYIDSTTKDVIVTKRKLTDEERAKEWNKDAIYDVATIYIYPDSFIAFYPNQIKSITNKTPTNSDNINEGVWQHKTNSYIDYKGDKVVGEYDEYEPQKDSKYKRLCQKPINTLTLEEIVYLFAIHQCIYMREFQPSLEDTLAQVEEEHIEDLEKCYDFVHSLKFPLTIYRTIREEEKDFNIGGKQRSYSWTTNINIYKNERSMFRNAVNIIAGEIEPNIIDNANTISNFVYYTARPSYGRFGEYEITLKKNFKSSDIANLRVVNKDDINERLNNINESIKRERK